jgi:hypothetical protein
MPDASVRVAGIARYAPNASTASSAAASVARWRSADRLAKGPPTALRPRPPLKKYPAPTIANVITRVVCSSPWRIVRNGSRKT